MTADEEAAYRIQEAVATLNGHIRAARSLGLKVEVNTTMMEVATIGQQPYPIVSATILKPLL